MNLLVATVGDNPYMLCSNKREILDKAKDWAGFIGTYFNRIKDEKIIEVMEKEMADIQPLPWR